MASRHPAAAGSRRSVYVIASLIVLVIVSFALARPYYPRTWPLDFSAFYCAGASVASHHDPYRTEPLRTCENQTRGFPAGSGFQFALPAPLPGYALAPFVALSRVPYRAAVPIWSAVLFVCFVSTVVLTRRLSDLRVETIVAAFLLQALLANFLGQIVPIVCAAALATGFLVSRGRDRAAACAAALTMIEPPLGLPVCLALFIARPRSRAVLAASGATLAALSLVLLGFDWNIEYLRDVLPAHALSEIANDQQYSLTYLAHLAGLGERSSLVLGTLSYIAMLGLGIAGGRVACIRTGKPELLVLVPPAFAILGGTFVHVTQLAIALPAALVLWGARIPHARSFAAAVFLLAVPWDALKFLSLNVPVVAGVTIVLAADFFALTPARAALVGAAAATLAVSLWGSIPSLPGVAVGAVDPREGVLLAEIGWRTAVEGNFRASFVENTIAKLPGWCGLLLFAIATLRLKRSRSPRRDRHAASVGTSAEHGDSRRNRPKRIRPAVNRRSDGRHPTNDPRLF